METARSAVGPKHAGRLLVIDDEPEVRLLLEDYLLSLGYEVRTAKDGSEGLHLIKTTCPDGVILDYQLPGLLGFDVLRIARAHGYARPIIILSGRLSREEVKEAIHLGAAAVLTKPFQIDDLDRVLMEVIGPA